jgi:hypothetical protein
MKRHPGWWDQDHMADRSLLHMLEGLTQYCQEDMACKLLCSDQWTVRADKVYIHALLNPTVSSIFIYKLIPSYVLINCLVSDYYYSYSF